MPTGIALRLYRQYQERLGNLNACDFGDLLLHNLTLFAKEPQVLAQYQQQFRYILVDEYQDSNVAQYLWLRLLAQGRRNLCCVGDDDQSIYGWRGAEVGNILRFESDFPGARIIRLERNYRSTGHILAAASGLIAHNRGRLGKTLHTDGEVGDQIRIRGVWDGEEEARQVGEEIEALQRRGMALGKIAILVRAGFQTREFEERFIKLGLPYRVLGGLRFYERQEVRDALAYLRLVHQPTDDLAFERIVNKPRRGIGDTTLRQIHATGRAAGLSLVEASRALAVTDELKPASRRALGGLVGDLDRWRAIAAGLPHAELAETVLDESGYTGMLQADKSPDAPGRLENLKELVAAMAEFESLPGFLEHVSLVMENAEGDPRDMVNIMTLHSAKGLEFDAVFLPGWEEGLFPSQRTLDENGTAGLEEERRLAYVGITRARKRVEISYAANRRVHNLWQNSLPSRFISEIPREHVEEDSAPGLRAMAEPALTRFEGLRDGWGQPRRAAPLIEGQASRVARDASYPPGARIFHRKFGYGSVVAAEGRQARHRLRQGGGEEGDRELRGAGRAGLVRKPAPVLWTVRLRLPAAPAEAAEIGAGALRLGPLALRGRWREALGGGGADRGRPRPPGDPRRPGAMGQAQLRTAAVPRLGRRKPQGPAAHRRRPLLSPRQPCRGARTPGQAGAPHRCRCRLRHRPA